MSSFSLAKKKSPRSATESSEAKALVNWWKLACRMYGAPENALLHIPNEGKRSVVMGAKLKAEGMRPGTPDYFLALPRPPHSGLWIELKRKKGGTLSDNQRDMLAMLEGQRYATDVCYGADQAITAIREYLKSTTTENIYE